MKLYAVAAAALFSASAVSAASVGNLGELDSFLEQYGGGGTFGQNTYASYGQTVTFDAGVSVTSFSFVVDDESAVRDLEPVTFNGMIAGWDGTGTTDPMYTFATQVTSDKSEVDGLSVVTVSIAGGLMLDAGTYAFVFDSIPGEPGFNGPAQWGTVNCEIDGCADGADSTSSDSYTGGEFIFSADNDTWASAGDGFDSAFQVTYDALTAVPVGAALPFMGTGLALLGFAGYRRRG